MKGGGGLLKLKQKIGGNWGHPRKWLKRHTSRVLRRRIKDELGKMESGRERNS